MSTIAKLTVWVCVPSVKQNKRSVVPRDDKHLSKHWNYTKPAFASSICVFTCSGAVRRTVYPIIEQDNPNSRVKWLTRSLCGCFRTSLRKESWKLYFTVFITLWGPHGNPYCGWENVVPLTVLDQFSIHFVSKFKQFCWIFMVKFWFLIKKRSKTKK